MAQPCLSCLSPRVQHLLSLGQCAVGQDGLGPHGLLDWDRVQSLCHYHSPPGSRLDYCSIISSLGSIACHVHDFLMSQSVQTFEENYYKWLVWTNTPQVFIDSFHLLISGDPVGVGICILKSTAILERALGDVYLLLGTECPFLLRDLLASAHLSTIFGSTTMDMLRVLLGTPQGLNLRNLLWHGFAAPQEIPRKYASLLLLVVASLGPLLDEFMQKMSLNSLAHRACFVSNCLDEMHSFPSLRDDPCILEHFVELTETSNFVLDSMRPYWRAALLAYEQRRFGDCVILCLPQLEMGLRKVYTRVNECPERLLTAESDVLYTTFDEILAEKVNNSTNLLADELGEPMMDILLDLLTYQEGPRLRDHVSHGEVDLEKIPMEIAQQVLAVVVLLMHQFTVKTPCEKIQESMCDMIIQANHYQSLFHPIGRLKRQITECTNSLDEWRSIPVPDGTPAECKTRGSEEMVQGRLKLMVLHSHEESDVCANHRATVSKCIAMQIPKWNEEADREMDRLHCSHMCLSCLHLGMLRKVRSRHRSRGEMEQVTALRNIVKQCHRVSSQVLESAKQRYQQWLKKELRSRRRKTYSTMVDSLPRLHFTLKMTLCMAVAFLHTLENSNTTRSEKLIKTLKMVLQCAENLAHHTSPAKNQWHDVRCVMLHMNTTLHDVVHITRSQEL
uniref:endoplasmic reticulum membrane-associated RNA degradation protein isoform X1 n=2 Tax=Myxine glutinosa TaxID=7769 RepID=UPI00358F66E7